MLKNYTSGIAASRSIQHIEEVLAAHKASEILKQYGPTGTVSAIAFIKIVNGIEMPFRVPARVGECEKVLCSRMRRPRASSLKRISQQAERTAWKIISDWVDSQMAMVELAQVEFMEVFLPYVFNRDRQQTYFESIKEHGYQNLLPASAVSGTSSKTNGINHRKSSP